MSIPNVIQSAATALIVGLIIKANTGGDKTKEAARAVEGLAIVSALQKLNSGDVADGVSAFQAAVQTSALDPSEAIALQSVLSFGSTQLSALEAVAGNTIIGQLESAVVTNILASAAQTCQAYIPAPVSPAA